MLPLCMLLLVMSATQPALGQSAWPEGLVSYWSADSNLKDSISGNNGTAVNGQTLVCAACWRGFHFDGVMGGVTVADSSSLRIGGSFTVACWIKVDSCRPGGPHQIFFRGDNRPGRDPIYIAAFAKPDRLAEVRFHIESDRESKEITAPIPLGKFVFLAASLDAGSHSMR